MNDLPHISVCICTFKRPKLLDRLLHALEAQQTDCKFICGVVVVDNDANESGRPIVEARANQAAIKIRYHVEPRQNIARARNRAVAASTGDFVAFIDDDECPPAAWLLNLWNAMGQHSADGVLGPVNPNYEDGAPKWLVEGGFFDRPQHPTGIVLHWRQCRTGNVLLKREALDQFSEPFDPDCLSGEDQDFFRRAMDAGRRFIWCHEAAVLEFVPRNRWKRSFLVRRALFRGIFAQRNHGLQPLRLLQAIISVPAYLLLLPFSLLRGQTGFMVCVFKLSYHAGRLLGLLRLNPLQQPYVTD